MFVVELARRARAAGYDLVTAAGHPGMSDSDLVANWARARGFPRLAAVLGWAVHTACQPVALGALPQLYAALAPDVRSGSFFAPGGRWSWWVRPVRRGCRRPRWTRRTGNACGRSQRS
ncbi:hypothetical protein GCM10029964_022400 [Kibdelosporangium lantanae]